MADETGRRSLVKLIDTFERLFPEEALSRVVVTRAGVEDGMIAFSARSLENWTNIVKEAIRLNGLKNLVDAATELQPNVPELRRAYDDYEKWAAANPVAPEAESPVADLKPPSFLERARLVIVAWAGIALACFAAVGIIARESVHHLFDLPNASFAHVFTEPGEAAESGLRFLGRTVVVLANFIVYNPFSAILTLLAGIGVFFLFNKRPPFIARFYAVPIAVVAVVALGAFAKVLWYDMPIFAFRGALTKKSIDVSTFEPPPLLAPRAESIWNSIVCSRVGNYQEAEGLCTARNALTYTKHLYATYFRNVLFTTAICILAVAVLRRLAQPSKDASWNLPRAWKITLITVTAFAALASLLSLPWTFARTVASMDYPYVCDDTDCWFRICLDADECYAYYPADTEIEAATPTPKNARIRTRDLLQSAFAEQLSAIDVIPPDRAQRLGGPP